MQAATSSRVATTAYLLAAAAAATFLMIVLGAPRAAAADTTPASPDAVPGQMIVRYAASTTEEAREAIADSVDASVVRNLRLPRTELVKVSGGTSVEEAIEALERDPRVLSAEPNLRLHVLATPNDSLFGQLWGLNNTGQQVAGEISKVDADIDAPEAWNMLTGSGQVVVAVIDTGVDNTHPDLADRIVGGRDFVDGDNNPFDLHGHGTHVAGTIGAHGNNTSGVAGVNWNVGILALRFLDESGSGTLANAIAAITYAGQQGVRIANGSFGCICTSPAMDAAIAAAKNTLFVFAAGNDGNNNDSTPVSPCTSNAPNIVCVAATDQNDRLAYFSNRGLRTVDLAAPGVNVLSTVPTSVDGNGYAYFSGTSMAAPHVAGVAALALALDPSLTTMELRDVILAGAEPVAGLSGAVATGGRLNAQRTLEAALVDLTTSGTLMYDAAAKQYFVRIGVRLDEACGQPCVASRVELSAKKKKGKRFLRLGGRTDVLLSPGSEVELDIPVDAAGLLKARYRTQGDLRVAQIRLQVLIQGPDGEFAPVLDGTLGISMEKIRSGEFPGLRGILPR